MSWNITSSQGWVFNIISVGNFCLRMYKTGSNFETGLRYVCLCAPVPWEMWTWFFHNNFVSISQRCLFEYGGKGKSQSWYEAFVATYEINEVTFVFVVYTLSLLVKIFRKVWQVGLATSVLVWLDLKTWLRWKKKAVVSTYTHEEKAWISCILFL